MLSLYIALLYCNSLLYYIVLLYCNSCTTKVDLLKRIYKRKGS
nr:MAG TPA: hypothetical protein [Caudoviricetes sp.]DAL65276.1 MAG TPA_asm: hypothetical protein [Caudoviricetes sp.]DAM05329.1 MAG TPA: hypothetical protein [Caudoviricetes sp.]DAT57653.1 MAG TPA: hypothetical protein [Caudoviricetes sp.]